MSVLDRSEAQGRADGPSVVALVLAAGRSERFTAGTKQLATVAGRSLVGHAVATARSAGIERIVVVVGHDGDAVAAAVRLEDPQARIVSNPDHATGQASSLTVGIREAALDDRVQVVVVLLADQPGIGAEPVRAVVTAVRGDVVAARARYADASGHPVAFSRRVFDRLAAVAGDTGARHLLDELDVAQVMVGGPVPRDVDTVEDLERVRAELG